MITLIVHDNKEWRTAMYQKARGDGEGVVLDDTLIAVGELAQYCYPSLFSLSIPYVHAQFVLSRDHDAITVTLVKELAASPTHFIFEEFSVPKTILDTFKKYGATIHTAPKQGSTKKKDDTFEKVSRLVTLSDKKNRWLAYRELVAQQPIEAMMGILYWKARQLAQTSPTHRALYESLLDAHARAWKSGVPLEILVEKVLLQ